MKAKWHSRKNNFYGSDANMQRTHVKKTPRKKLAAKNTPAGTAY